MAHQVEEEAQGSVVWLSHSWVVVVAARRSRSSSSSMGVDQVSISLQEVGLDN